MLFLQWSGAESAAVLTVVIVSVVAALYPFLALRRRARDTSEVIGPIRIEIIYQQRDGTKVSKVLSVETPTELGEALEASNREQSELGASYVEAHFIHGNEPVAS
jgi:hypothetical protein